jgi:hypothetical protein
MLVALPRSCFKAGGPLLQHPDCVPHRHFVRARDELRADDIGNTRPWLVLSQPGAVSPAISATQDQVCEQSRQAGVTQQSQRSRV